MNRDDVIRMADDADLGGLGVHGDYIFFQPGTAGLERFAALVAAHERKACAKVCKDADAEIADAEILAERILARGNG